MQRLTWRRLRARATAAQADAGTFSPAFAPRGSQTPLLSIEPYWRISCATLCGVGDSVGNRPSRFWAIRPSFGPRF
jgi:hypothetical protein